MRGGLEEGWIQNLRTEIEPEVWRHLEEDWTDEAKKYICKLEEQEKEKSLNNTIERGVGKRNAEGENTKEEE